MEEGYFTIKFMTAEAGLKKTYSSFFFSAKAFRLFTLLLCALAR